MAVDKLREVTYGLKEEKVAASSGLNPFDQVQKNCPKWFDVLNSDPGTAGQRHACNNTKYQRYKNLCCQ